MAVGRGVRDWMRALVGVSGVVAMLGGLFVSLPASAGEVGVDGVASAQVLDGSSSSDGVAGDGAGASAAKAPAAGVSGSPAAPAAGPRARSGISPQDYGGNTLDCSTGRQTGTDWYADDAGGGRCAVHVTGRDALQGNSYGYTAKFGVLDLDKVVSVSIDNPIQLAPRDHVWLAELHYLTSLTGLSNLKNATDLSYAFKGDSALTSLDVSGLDTSQVTDMHEMFQDMSGLTSLTGLSSRTWDTSRVTNMLGMFDGVSGLRSLDLSRFDTSKVADMSIMFRGVSDLTLDVSRFDTSNVTDMSGMFMKSSGLRSLDVSHFDTSRVTDMSCMFSWASGLRSLDLSHFNTSNVKYMREMFSWASGLTSLDVSGWDTSHVTNMGGMFSWESGLSSLDLSGWDTSNVTDMSYMFMNASGLRSLDLSGWDASNVWDMDGMFWSASGLRSLRLGPHTYFRGGYSGLSGRWTQVDPAPVPGACYVNGGDQASCSTTTDPDQGLLFRPASGGPGQVRTGAVTYAMGNLIRLNYVDAQGNPLAAGVVSGLGLPSWRAGDPGDGFSVALPGNAAWKFTSCSSNPTASPADSCS
ncbi:BspA family leucine-rich repeat surface protein, partial [Bifidobacterium bombi]